MTYGAVLYADYVVVRWIVLQTMSTTLWGSLHVLLFNIIIFMLFMSHARAVFSDPGIVPLPKHRIDFSDSHSAKIQLYINFQVSTYPGSCPSLRFSRDVT